MRKKTGNLKEQDVLQVACLRAPGMGDNLAVKVRYRLGSRNC